jgi:hypothetical protein
MNLNDLQKYGQSIGLDSIRRDLLTGGELVQAARHTRTAGKGAAGCDGVMSR